MYRDRKWTASGMPIFRRTCREDGLLLQVINLQQEITILIFCLSRNRNSYIIVNQIEGCRNYHNCFVNLLSAFADDSQSDPLRQ